MDYCEYNLETYLNHKRKKPFSINEIRDTLIQINNTIKLILKEQIIYKEIKLKNILISLDALDKIII